MFLSFCGYSQTPDSTNSNASKKFTIFNDHSKNNNLLNNEELLNVNYNNLKQIKNGGANILIGSVILLLGLANQNSNNIGTFIGVGFIGLGGLKISNIRIPENLKPQSKRKSK